MLVFQNGFTLNTAVMFISFIRLLVKLENFWSIGFKKYFPTNYESWLNTDLEEYVGSCLFNFLLQIKILSRQNFLYFPQKLKLLYTHVYIKNFEADKMLEKHLKEVYYKMSCYLLIIKNSCKSIRKNEPWWHNGQRSWAFRLKTKLFLLETINNFWRMINAFRNDLVHKYH